MSSGESTEPTRPKRDWLDVVAPTKTNAIREAAGGMFLFAAVGLAGGVWMIITQPFWELSWRLPIPLGILAILAILTGAWFSLLGANVLRRTRKGGR